MGSFCFICEAGFHCINQTSLNFVAKVGTELVAIFLLQSSGVLWLQIFTIKLSLLLEFKIQKSLLKKSGFLTCKAGSKMWHFYEYEAKINKKHTVQFPTYK